MQAGVWADLAWFSMQGFMSLSGRQTVVSTDMAIELDLLCRSRVCAVLSLVGVVAY